MNKTILQIQLLYDDMGKSERKIADWLIGQRGEILPYSITELAERCGSSEATIVRFARRLGFGGYQELKLAIAKEHNKKTVSPTILADDDCYSIFEKICNDAYLSLERTKRTLTSSAMSQAADAIGGARRVVIIGLGSSAYVAEDMSHKLLSAGCNCTAYRDTHIQTVAVSQLKKGDTVIGISQSGTSKDIAEAMKIARAKGAKTIGITSRERSAVAKLSDILLLTDTEETRHSTLGLSSHISRLVVIDSLCYKVVYMNEERAQMIVETADELLSKRINTDN